MAQPDRTTTEMKTEIMKNLKYDRRNRGNAGSVLIAALGIILVLDLFLVVALALSMRQLNTVKQERTGSQAFNVAEAGLNTAIWKVGNVTNYAPTVESPDVGQTQTGEYEVTMSTLAIDRRQITVTSYIPNRTDPKAKKRRIVATIEVAPKVLSYGMYAFSWIDIRGATARTYLAPLDYTQPGAKGGDMGSNYGIYFNDSGIRLNDRGNQSGEQSTYDALFGNPSVELGDLVTAGPNSEVHAVNEVATTQEQLHSKCKYVWMARITHLNNTIQFPTLNFEGPGGYKSMAEDNTSNGGKYGLPAGRNSVFTKAEFATIISANNDVTLTGVIYVDGEVNLPNNRNLTINDGGIVIKDNPSDTASALSLANRASLRVLHGSTESKKYPGLIVYTTVGNTASVVDRGTMEIEGLVFSEKTYSEQQSSVRIKGVLLASGTSAAASIVNDNSSIIIQYDPTVTDMSGLQSYGDLFVKRVIQWRETNPG